MSEIIDAVPLTAREAASGIFGSVSIACWIFLLVPQLIENYKYGSAEALSLTFLIVWFIGDVANLVGALWAQLVPVVIAIAVYFCIADGVLISQCTYYNVKNSRQSRDQGHEVIVGRDGDGQVENDEIPDPTTPLLSRRMSENLAHSMRRVSVASLRRMSSRSKQRAKDSYANIIEQTEPRSTLVKNILGVLGICIVGIGGWTIAWKTGIWKPTSTEGDDRKIAAGAEILGYFSALCYLGARIPQIIKNYREKSCEGLSILFFIFSLLGNATYGAGILFHSTSREYFLNNLPWLIGSLGTMVEDMIIFVQFRIYAVPDELENSAIV